jgi:enoyl-CoA hydratase/carnithine racemase
MKAAEWLLFGEPFSGEDAYAAGLVTALVPAGEVEAHAAERAEKLAALPPASVRLTKQLLRRPDADAVQQTIRHEGEHFVQRLQSDEAAEALSAFFEKRTPDFSRFD